MRPRLIPILVLTASIALSAQASEADDDWKLFGGMLSLVQSLVRVAAASDDPQAMQRGVDGILAGRNADANRLAGELMQEMTEDMPAQYRGTVRALAQDMLVIARREQARAAAAPPASEREPVETDARAGATDRARVIQARKDLAAMGLRYYDADQYREALRRNDTLAIELFVAGRGL